MRLDVPFFQAVGTFLIGIAAIGTLFAGIIKAPAIGEWFRARRIIIEERDNAQARAESARAEATGWHSAHAALKHQVDTLGSEVATLARKFSALTKFTREVLVYTEQVEEIAQGAGLTLSHLERPVVPDILVDALEGVA